MVDFKAIPTPGDGACLFNALSYACFDESFSYANLIRKRIVESMRKQKEEVKKYLKENENIDEYIEKMEDIHTYGDI